MSTDTRIVNQLKERQRRPATPGDVLADLLEDRNLSITEAARRLGVGRVALSHVINGHTRLSPDMAHRLGRFFGDGPGIWLRLQQKLDMWDTLHMDTAPYSTIEPVDNQRDLVAA